jgi:hypothetical protein
VDNWGVVDNSAAQDAAAAVLVVVEEEDEEFVSDFDADFDSVFVVDVVELDFDFDESRESVR